MKTIVLTLVLFFLTLTNISAQWEIINEGHNGLVNTFDFVNEKVGWLAGSNGLILKTIDFGESFKKLEINQNWFINQIDFINDSLGWLIGLSDSLIETSLIAQSFDGGDSWTVKKVIYDFVLQLIFVVNENNVYVTGINTIDGSSKIFKTNNSGADWIDISPISLNRYFKSLWFQNESTGIVVGTYYDSILAKDKGLILRTENGGISWSEILVDKFNSINDLQFLDSTNGYFIAKLDTINFLCQTNDMCSSWKVKIQHPYKISAYQNLSADMAFVVMADSTSRNKIYKSTNGGVTWQDIQTFDVSYLSFSKIIFTSSGDGFILGKIREFRYSSNGFALLKTNNEKNFEIKEFSFSIGEWMRSPFPSDINFVNESMGFIGISFPGHASGGDHSIFYTTDGGNSWILGNRADGYIVSFSSISDSVGFYSTEWYMYKTTGGNSWFKSSEFTDGFTGHDNIFIDIQNGWVVGIHDNQPTYWWRGRIMRTTDGGINWNIEWTDSTDYSGLNSLCITSQIIWAVGDYGTILNNKLPTGWQKYPSLTTLPLNRVFFSDDNNGWIAGGYHNENNFQNILIRTTNGGDNWEKVLDVPYLIKDMVFLDNNLGWAIGYDSSGVGGILKSADGGNTWTIDTGNLTAKLNALHIKNGYGWVVGENGLILRTTNAGPTWVGNENKTLLTEFMLEQNYPNPFNPITKIRYTIPNVETGHAPSLQQVKLILYDILGREVATLVNENQKPGNYEIEFSSLSGIRYLASGIYLYKLITDDYSATKKMILLK